MFRFVMPMYNLIQYSKNYRKTAWRLWNYYKDKLSDDTNNSDNNLFKYVINSESFAHKISISGSIYNFKGTLTDT